MKGAPRDHSHGDLASSQLSPKTWPDFERLFSENGGVWGGCWCMFFQRPKGFDASAYDKNRKDKRSLVKQGLAHGTIVYCGGDPVGWCEFGPREELPRVDAKKGYVPSSEGAWRITCLFVSKGHRKRGLARLAVDRSLLAMEALGAKAVEAYPVDGVTSSSLLWSGTPGLFRASGFTRVSRLGKSSWVYLRTLS